MKAVTYQGPNHVQVNQVEDAKLEKKTILLLRLLLPLFADLICIYIKVTCHYPQDILLATNQWVLWKKLDLKSQK